MTQPCLVVPYETADGPSNMALDEAMLEAVGADASVAFFRTYGWTVPTLSLGYFQKIADAEREPRWSSVPIVRRPTGGGAIWHDHELTYALALPSNHPVARGSRDLYRAVHHAIAQVLRAGGVAVERSATNSSRKIVGGRPFLCFTDRDPEDIVSSDWKLVGSAQRRRLGAILQHGSMLLVRSAITPELPGACDLAPATRDVRFWSSQLNDKVPLALGLTPSVGSVPTPLLRRARELACNLYCDNAWTRKR